MKYLSFSLILFFLFSCKESTPPPAPESMAVEEKTPETPFQDISVDEAKALMQTQANIQLVDVRTPEETGQGIIEGAFLADINNPDFPQKIASLDTSKTYIVYCAVGGRSKTASGYMQSKGFGHVYNLLGGYNAWSEAK